MNKKFKKALQDSFMPPPPKDKERFIQQLEEKQNRRDALSPLFFIRHSVWFRRSATVFCAAAVLGIGYDVYQTYTSGRQQLEITEPSAATKTTDITLETTVIVTTNTAVTSASLSEQNNSYTDATNSEKTINTTGTHFKESETESKSQQDTKQNTVNTTQETTATQTRETAVSKTTTTSKAVTSAKEAITATRATTKSKSTTAAQEENNSPPPSTQATAVTAVTKAETTTRQINLEPVPAQTSTVPHDTDDCPSDSPSADTADYTVVPTKTYTTSDKIVREEELIENSIDPSINSGGKIYNDLSELCANATDIVTAYTQNVYYTSINGVPWIQIDVVIQNAYQSDTLHSGDRISIYLNGGYMPLSEFLAQNNLMLDMTNEEIAEYNLLRWNDSTPLPTVGDTYLYFLKKGYSELPEGSYMRITENDSAQFSYNQSSGFSSANPRSKISFSLETLLTTLKSLY